MYSLHMRKNIIDIKKNEKLSIREAARRFGISPNTVYKWRKKIELKEWRKQRVSKIDIKNANSFIKLSLVILTSLS